MTPGEKLKYLRALEHLTQFEMAEVLNSSVNEKKLFRRTQLAYWETGKNVIPIKHAKIIVRYFRITLDDLFFEENRIMSKAQVNRARRILEKGGNIAPRHRRNAVL